MLVNKLLPLKSNCTNFKYSHFYSSFYTNKNEHHVLSSLLAEDMLNKTSLCFSWGLFNLECTFFQKNN